MSGNAGRVQAVSQIVSRTPMSPKTPLRLEDIWAENVFSLAKMKASLPKAVFKSVKKTVTTGEKLDPSVADAVAAAMKDWATSKGAHNYAPGY